MRVVIWFTLTLLLLSQTVSAKKNMVLTFTPSSGNVMCANDTLLVNVTNQDNGRGVDGAQLDLYYGDDKVEYAKTDYYGFAALTPASTGIYRVNAEKGRYRSREIYLTIKSCVTTTTSVPTASAPTTTSINATTTIACMFDDECVVCHGECLHEDAAEEECKLDLTKTCECTGGGCVRAATTTTIQTTTTIFFPTTTTLPVKHSWRKQLSGLILLVLAVIALALYGQASRVVEKPTKLGGKTKRLRNQGGKSRLEKA